MRYVHRVISSCSSYKLSLVLTVYMQVSAMLGVVETPLKNVLMNVDTSSAEEAVGSASRWSGSISGPACGQICRMGKISVRRNLYLPTILFCAAATLMLNHTTLPTLATDTVGCLLLHQPRQDNALAVKTC